MSSIGIQVEFKSNSIGVFNAVSMEIQWKSYGLGPKIGIVCLTVLYKMKTVWPLPGTLATLAPRAGQDIYGFVLQGSNAVYHKKASTEFQLNANWIPTEFQRISMFLSISNAV